MEEGSGAFEGAVVLAEVDAVGIEFGGEGWKIVEDEGNARGAAEREDAAGDGGDEVQRLALGAELEEIGSTGEEGGGDGFRVLGAGVAEIEEAVEAGRKVQGQKSSEVNNEQEAPETDWSGTVQPLLEGLGDLHHRLHACGGKDGAGVAMILFPFVYDFLEQAGNLDWVIAVDAAKEQIRATTDVNLIFLRPCDPAMILVGFLFHPFVSSMALATSFS